MFICQSYEKFEITLKKNEKSRENLHLSGIYLDLFIIFPVVL